MRYSLMLIFLVVIGLPAFAQVRPDFFTEETNPTNSNFEVYSQKGGLSRRASLANLRKYFGAAITTSSTPAPTGNVESLRNKVIVVLPDSVTYFVDWNGVSVRLGGGNTGGGELENAYISNDTIFLDTPDSLYTIVLPDELSTELFQDSIVVYKTNNVETGRDTIRVPGGGGGGSGTVTSVAVGVGLTASPSPITTTGTISADTSGVLASKIFVTTRGYTTGTGTTNTIPKWTSSTALGNSLITDDGTGVAVGGTSALRLPNGTTAQRPATPLPGETRYSTTNGALEYYGASTWETPVKSATATGLGTAGRVLYADADGRAAADDLLYWDATNNRLAVGGSTSVDAINATGGIYILTSGASLAFRVRGSDGSIILGANGAQFAPSNVVGNTFGATLGTLGFAPPSNWQSSGNNLQYLFLARNNTSGTSGDAVMYKFGGDTWSPSSGIGSQTYINISSTYNQTGTASGNVIGIDYNPTVTSVLGNHYAALFRSGRVGIGNAAPSRTLHVTGEARVTDLTTTTATVGVGADADGVLSSYTFGSGLSFGSNTLTASNIYNANGTLTGARTVTLGSNTLTFSGTAGAPAGVNFSMTPSTNTIAMQSLDGSLNNSTFTVAPASTRILVTNITGGSTTNTFEVFADSVKVSPSSINENNSLTRLLAINASTGRLQYVTKSTIGLSDPGSNGILARTSSGTTTARTITAGSGIAISNGDGVSGNPTISQTYSLTHITISGGSTTFNTTAERPDNDTPGTQTTSTVGSDFSVSGSTLDYTGANGALIRVEGSISFSVSDNTDVYVSIYKEGTELSATSTRLTCTAGDYYTIPIPATTTASNTNDTYEVRIATVTGTTTSTVHRYGFILERIY